MKHNALGREKIFVTDHHRTGVSKILRGFIAGQHRTAADQLFGNPAEHEVGEDRARERRRDAEHRRECRDRSICDIDIPAFGEERGAYPDHDAEDKYDRHREPAERVTVIGRVAFIQEAGEETRGRAVGNLIDIRAKPA